MGVDIDIKIINKDGKILVDNILNGIRNYEWFDNLQGRGFNAAYNYLPKNRINEINTENLDIDEFDYGVTAYRLQEFLDWYETYSPNWYAGWVPKWKAFNYRERNIPLSPEDLLFMVDKDEVHNYEWVEYANPYDPCTEIIIIANREIIGMDSYLFFSFNS